MLTWNLWWRFGNWEERQPAIEATLRSLDVDVVALQETWPEQAEHLADTLGWNHAFSGTRPSDRHPNGFGNAILSRHPIRTTREITLPALEGPAYRSALFAQIVGPTTIDVYTTHLAHRFSESPTRVAQLTALSDFVCDHSPTNDGAGQPTLLMGDLNAVPDSDEIRRLTGRATPYHPESVWSDAWEQVGQGTGITWSDANPYTGASTWPNRRIDYVLSRWPRTAPTGNPASATLVGREPIDGVVASDHWGVLVEIVTG